MHKNLKGHITLGNLLSVIAIIVSIASILISNRLNNKTNTLTEKVYSKEHEMSENLKYEILNMISTLRSIDAKASCEPFYPEKVDYSNEIKSLEKIQSSPEYLLFLKSIKSFMVGKISLILYGATESSKNDTHITAFTN